MVQFSSVQDPFNQSCRAAFSCLTSGDFRDLARALPTSRARMCRAATPPLDKLAVASASSLAAGHELHAPSEADLAREGPLSREQVAEFYESGVVLVRGLLQGDLLDRVLAVRRSVGTMMPNAETYGTVKTEAWREHACFLDVALRSPLAAAAEQLTPDEVRGAGRGKPLHVLRDGFFSLSPGKRGCGWRARRPPRPAQKTLPRHVLGLPL